MRAHEACGAVRIAGAIPGPVRIPAKWTSAVVVRVGHDRIRGRLSLLPYIWLVYSCAAVVLLVVVLIMGLPMTGYSPQGYLWLVATALVPQLIGHSSLNFALK